jgi:glyoxylase-like metal-dependent hydrolase (beta-lactamase superfamily II)
LRVIHTPGHTAGDVCFLDERSGALFAGDVLLPHNYKLGTVLSKPDPVCGGRMQDKIESLRKLLRYPVHHLFAGHGEPMLHNGGDQLKIALYSLYQSLHEGHSELAWVAVGRDLLEVGLSSEARQCAAKARDINPECADLKDFEKRLAEAGHGQE